MNPADLTATEGTRLVAARRLSALEWSSACLERARSLEPTLRAFVDLDGESWLERARILDDRIGTQKPRALAGLPLGVKDTMNTRDLPTGMGSALWKGFTPGNDARVVTAALEEQALVAGKTVTAEFAVHTPNETRNPRDPSKSPGTSSSGSAAAVAAGVLPAALGTQTGGSIIRPASYCGAWGMKPSFGLIPRTGMLKTTDSLDTVGFFGRSAADLGLLLDALRVRGPDYPFVHRRVDSGEGRRRVGQGFKVAVLLEGHGSFEHLEPTTRSAFATFMQKLSGHPEITLTEPRLPALAAESHSIHTTIYHRALAYYFQTEFKHAGKISDVIRAVIEEGRGISLEAYQMALANQEILSHQMDETFAGIDILLTPSTAGPAPDFGTAIDPPDTCLLWTLCGLSVASVPALRVGALPVGVQAVARRFSDEKLVDFLMLLEEQGLVRDR
ncbi:MAG: amidase [Planctomycetota bacterium]